MVFWSYQGWAKGDIGKKWVKINQNSKPNIENFKRKRKKNHTEVSQSERRIELKWLNFSTFINDYFRKSKWGTIHKSIKYVRSNLVIFKQPLPPCTLLNKEWRHKNRCTVLLWPHPPLYSVHTLWMAPMGDCLSEP